jgi:hypothetical protein
MIVLYKLAPWLHRYESELLKRHALLNWAIAMSDVRTLFFANSRIAHRTFSFAQKIKDRTSLMSDRTIFKSNVPSSGFYISKDASKKKKIQTYLHF